MMKILVIGGGGREHALVWKLKQSPAAEKIYCAPGNAGIAQLAECVPIPVDDLDALLDFAKKEEIGLTVVGPELPLSMGIVDRFQEAGLRIFGASKAAAELEGSKTFAKEIMAKYQVPTAQYARFENAAEAVEYIKKIGAPVVVKADGLAAGKGVVVAMDEETAIDAVHDMLDNKCFGSAGGSILVEEYLQGEEVSILAFSDGKTVVPMVSAQDHKRVYDGDRGPNTGGMGAYSPAPIYTADIADFVMKRVLQPVVDGMRAEGKPYVGVLYAGLMLTETEPKVLEFNARFGDPEAQPVLFRLESDLLTIMEACIDGKLAEQEIKWREEPAVCVVIVSGGYPGHYEKGFPIEGLDVQMHDAYVFHAGTALKDGRIVNAGGRVLGVTASGRNLSEAIEAAYELAGQISFPTSYYRMDIGAKGLRLLNGH